MDNLLKIQQLIKELNEASEAYYNGRNELMTDNEWDAKFDQLKQLEEETNIFLPDSPTQKVSEDNIYGQKEDHEFPALSLAKTKQIADLVKWAEGKPIWLSWKLDGMTLVVTYDDGVLSKVVTRGNGHTGTNITHLAKAIKGIPSSIGYKGHLVIRGEAVISYEDFEQYNIENDEEYANPRNLASGSLTLKDPKEVAERHIHWLPFTLVFIEHEIISWGERMDFLTKLGFDCVKHEKIAQPTVSNIEMVIDQWSEQVLNRTNPYPVDGLVITYDDTVYASTGSVTGHHATRSGFAFKWQDESATTTLQQIEWSCAASTISPVAIFEPVELEGTTVKRASLCNISECERLGIGAQGTQIEVIKANKIIPKVIKVVQPIGNLHIPTLCPVCSADTKIIVSPQSGTKTLHCTNTSCPAKQLKKFKRFVSKEGVNMDGISEQTIAKYINLGWVSEYADLYHLSAYTNEMRQLEGFGDKSVANIMQSIEKARQVEPLNFIYALCIPLIGQDVAKRLLGKYSIEELLNIVTDNSQCSTNLFSNNVADLLAMIPGIGPEKSASFVNWFKHPDNLSMVQRLRKEITFKESLKTETGNRCSQLTFVITGDVHHYKNRSELKQYIESQGGKVTSAVSKSTNFLINNDTTSQSSKNKKAQDLSIPIISEDEFIRRFVE